MANQQPSFNSVIEQMLNFKSVCSQVEGFRLSGGPAADWREAADLVEAGKEAEAAEMGLKALNGFRAVLSAFLRNSVLPQKSGENERPGYFARLIAEREADGYDEDIVARLRKKLDELEQAVRVETNGTFERRIEAYASMKSAIAEADEKQRALDEKRRLERIAVEKRRKMASWNVQPAKPADESSTVARRQQVLAERKKIADTARALI